MKHKRDETQGGVGAVQFLYPCSSVARAVRYFRKRYSFRPPGPFIVFLKTMNEPGGKHFPRVVSVEG